MKIEALIRILQYCEDNNIEIDYGTKESISGGGSYKRCLVKYVNGTNDYFTKGRLYIGTIYGSNIEIEDDNQGDPHIIDGSNFSFIKEI